MTEQHPLTDDTCQSMSSFYLPTHLTGEFIKDDMRAAADWQLEQVKAKVEKKLQVWRKSGYEYMAYVVEGFFNGLLEEMRPQQQEEL